MYVGKYVGTYLYTVVWKDTYSWQTYVSLTYLDFRNFIAVILNVELFVSGEKKYVCEICNKRFAQHWALTSHLRIHNNEKPATCLDCGHKFRTSSDMR